ncbi:mechanosensitive ion channel family protein [Alkaliphilus sp. MSJ-5]|uniref:Mechanosensitive ion channel family protein n=1 Tax=Alkaliphilus flagellatus TaxID=2841507 RepID=A0ABS6G6V6_9FIRM|nr:mechanosensitive ion channel family protein [Alkaliphilus flagellatus]MBU5678201.1 mechanosensitive ion channel family protein [Alkaliphilus flagellatus]
METINKSLTTVFQETMDFLKNPEQFSKIIGNAIKIILILIIAKLSVRIFGSIINQFFEKQKKLKFNIDTTRIDTMKGLVKSILTYVIYFIAFTAVIKFFGIEITGLIATAGIGGLAIGFGAQNLVRDIITGFFILFEEQFGVGHYVEVNGVSGIVEEMALRVTKIRDFNGDLHIVPNGEISKVTNKSSGNMRALVEMSIAYEEDIDNAIAVLNKASEKLGAENEQIVEGPTVLGVSKLENSYVVISIVAKTLPMEQWAIERLMRKTFKEAFDNAGIEIPYPRTVVITKKD